MRRLVQKDPDCDLLESSDVLPGRFVPIIQPYCIWTFIVSVLLVSTRPYPENRTPHEVIPDYDAMEWPASQPEATCRRREERSRTPRKWPALHSRALRDGRYGRWQAP